MFYVNQSRWEQDQYQQFLRIVGTLSNLFSESKTPYLYYRIAEKIFCRAFDAEDLSRSDVSADAKKGKLGIGLKTFLSGNNNTFQKVAEFNAARSTYSKLTSLSLVKKVCQLRNERINFTESMHGIEHSIYHCIVRNENKFSVYEECMDLVDINNIKIAKNKNSSIIFDDGLHEYSFLKSKSTLTKRFKTNKFIVEFDVGVIKDPLLELQNCFNRDKSLLLEDKKILDTVYLPLYGRNKKVFEKSGLNQWNAGGRDRHSDEVYIPVPILIHKLFPNYFPKRDVPFSLRFPDGEKVTAKICQASGKALMTQSNRKLGKLILRDGLNLNQGELVTYQKLQLFGIDSVRIDKINDLEFEINFSKNGSYEEFIARNL
ncbi:MAG: NgoFVII family restriction endonuclease [Gammaproteobacteria bacterium]|nr:MAG: NgoFVII family restriction endonuclease [Gammaproteobacteria bacterium]